MEESKKDRKRQGEPNLLDGSPPCPRQKLEGSSSSEASLLAERPPKAFLELVPQPYDKYFNFSEYITYTTHNHNKYKWETTNQHIARDDEWFALADRLDPDYIIDYYDQLRQTRRKELSEQIASKNRYELGAREFTFTYSPKWFDDSEARLQMSSAIQKLCKYYKDEIIQLRAIGEVGSAGLSHIHCFYKLKNGKKITDKNFTRAYKMWNTKKKTGPSGHQGGHHATVKNESDFSGYIDKDIESAWFEVNIDNASDPR